MRAVVSACVYVSDVEGALPAAEAGAYFPNFWPHAEACVGDEELRELQGLRSRPCQFVVVEDFGTTGLIGDENSYEEPGRNERNDFFYFFRAEGKSGKSEANRGRWGVGKYVFPKASKVSSFLAMTVRENGPGEAGPLVMGQAVMRNHKWAEKNWEPDGWWATLGGSGHDVPVPARDIDFVSEFRSTWHLERVNQPGLSVVIPYVRERLTLEDLRRSVVRDYFVAIIEGKLTVDIEAYGGRTCHIDRNTLDTVIDELPEGDRDRVRKDAGIVRWALEMSDSAIVVETPTGPPVWSPELIDDSSRRKAVAALDSDRGVIIRIMVAISERGSVFKESFFDVLLMPDLSSRSRPLYVREGIIVSEVRSSPLQGVRAIVLASSGVLADLLGDAEGPAHTNWSEKTDRFRGKYRYGPRWLAFVKQSPWQILRIIRRADEEEDRTLAEQFFSVTSEEGDPYDDKPAARRLGSTRRPQLNSVGTSPQKIRTIRRQHGGFTIRLTPDGADLTRIDVQAAYDRERGNPFTKWSPEDFEFRDLDVEVTGGKIIEQDGNRLAAAVEDPEEFSLRVGGFDVNRDLRVSSRGKVGK